MKKENAITLIALVISIIVIIILSGVVINTLINGGIIDKAKSATQEYKNAQDYEETQIAKYTNEIDNYIDGSRTETIINAPIFINTKNKIKNYESISDGSSYTATEDCAINFVARNNDGGRGLWITIDDCTVFHIYDNTYYQYSNTIYLKKGQTIKFSKDGAWPNNDVGYTVYGLF